MNPKIPFLFLFTFLAINTASGATLSYDAKPELTKEVALGVAAKRLCSSLFISGRSFEDIVSQELNNPLLDELEYDIGEDLVTTRMGGMQVQALYRGPLGCTLVKDTTVEALRAELDLAKVVPLDGDQSREWPLGNSVSLPEAVPGLDLAAVNAAVDEAFEDMVPDQNIRTRAVLVAHKGKIIAERYAEPFNAAMPQLGWSMTKTLTGTLTGMAAEEGLVDIKAPAPVPLWSREDPRSAITLENLLHMSDGLPFSELSLPGILDDSILMLYTSGDTGRYAAEKPLQHAPGALWSYSSGTSNIISRALREPFESHLDYVNYPRERLFKKIGMNSAVLELDASGVYVGSSYLWATPRDWAKLGLLYLQDGVWNDERILPEGWVDYATTPASAAPKGNYGAHVWLNVGEEDKPANRPKPSLPATMYYLSGYEGQNVVMFPDEDLIVVRLGLTATGPRPTWKLAESVLAAIE